MLCLAGLLATTIVVASGAAPEATPASIAAGSYHACALVEGGVRCWGHGVRGQLGDGQRLDRPLPVPAKGMDGAVEVAAGEWFSCARRQDGSVWCWGANDHGELGREGPDSLVPVQVAGVRGALGLAAGGRTACARTRDDVWCWGTLGITSSPKARALGTAGVVALSLGTLHGCLLQGDGRVRCFGANYAGQLGGAVKGLVSQPLPDLPDMVGVSAGGYESCAWTAAGEAWCWGDNGSASITRPASRVVREPTLMPALREVKWVHAAVALTCALGRDQQLRCQGAGGAGQLGPTPGKAGTATIVPVARVVELASGSRHLCARRDDGGVECWGGNAWGELGDGTTSARPRSRPVLGLTPP